jgi:hypothetical protein
MQYSKAAVGQTVTSPVAPAAAAGNNTPDVNAPDTGNQTITPVNMTISKSRHVPVRWNGEEQLSLNNNGANYTQLIGQQFTQAMRTLVNEIEADLAALYVGASRSVGTAGTNPFGTSSYNHEVIPDASKCLKDNGLANDMQFCFNTSAGANFQKIGNLYKVNEAGGDDLLRRGIIGNLNGFAIRESAQIKDHTKGTAANATTTADGYAVGDTEITLANAGTGTIVAGDTIKFANDDNLYGVKTGCAAVANGVIVLAAPGLRQAIPASTTAITMSANHTANMAFTRSAICLATRLPASPVQGDMATDKTVVTDPVSGLSFEVAEYKQFMQVVYHVRIAWGVALVKPEGLIKVFG